MRILMLTTRVIVIAKSCPSRSEPGTSTITDPPNCAAILTNRSLQFKEDPDAWLMVDDILSRATYEQTKCLHPPWFDTGSITGSLTTK